MSSEHSAHSTPLPVGFRSWLSQYTCLFLLISMLWPGQAIFKSKGDKLSSSTECRIWTQGLYDQRAFSPFNPNANWLSHLALAKYMFVVVNFDALVQASDFQIERRQVVFLCWMQDLNQGFWNRISSRLNARWQTDWAIEDQAKKMNLTARPYDQLAFSPLDPTASWLLYLALAIYMCAVANFGALAQASDFQIERRQVAFLCWMQDLSQGYLPLLNAEF